ncbi:hypothetical protein MPLSOD_270098 [Mesorhizobium sp. SOD10]|nr:hypothetical protein MPLSOD_270098 [Mesorhizobium sp. SOD10]
MSSTRERPTFRPLVYTVAFGDNTYFECLNIMLTSLLEFGDFNGNIAIVSDRKAEEIRPYIPRQYRSRIHFESVTHINICQRYIISSHIFNDYSPIMYLDTDVVVDADIESILRDVLEADGVCVTTESSGYPELASSKIADVIDSRRIGNWFGLELCRADPECAQRFLPCANSGIIGYKDAEFFRPVGAQVARLCQDPTNRELIRWFGDQPILNYVLVRTQTADTEPLDNRCKFVREWDQYIGEPSGFRHFVWSRGIDKVQQMASYLEHLRRSRVIDIERTTTLRPIKEYAPYTKEKLEISPYIFIVTSALGTTQGVLSPQVRLAQTLGTIRSIKNHVPKAFILLVDSSSMPLNSGVEDDIRAEVDIAVFLNSLNPGLHLSRDLGGFWETSDYSKTLSETYSLIHALSLIKVISSGKFNKRIFKISGRYQLSDGFDINRYTSDDMLGKYVFKRRGHPWLEGTDGYFDTRLWSLCSTTINSTLEILSSILTSSIDNSLDAEHSYFRKFPHDSVYEVATIHVAGQIASTGEELSE